MSQKQKKVLHSNQSYSHPLIKSTEQPIQEDHTKIIPTYQPIIPSHQHRTSSKLLRYTTLTPHLQSNFTVFASLFHPIIEDIPAMAKLTQCPVCCCIINPYSKIVNYSTLQCNLCGQISEIQGHHNDVYKTSYAYQQINPCSAVSKGRICIVIQASQQCYQSNLHKGIISCIQSLKDQDLQIGFILFDDKSISFINQSIMEVTKIKIQKQSKLEGWDALPVSQSQLFRHISQFNQEIQEMIDAIMYQAYFIKQTVLEELSSLLSKCINRNYQIKLFINTISNTQKHQVSSKFNLLKAFKQRQNQAQQPRVKKDKIIVYNKGSKLNVSQNMQFFIFAKQCRYEQFIKQIGYNICKIYDKDEVQRLQQAIYYDLYENIQKIYYLNIIVTIRTNNCIELVNPQYPSYNHYGNIEIISSTSNGHTFRQYRLRIKRCSSSTTIPLKFKVNQQSTSRPFFQISYQYYSNGSNNKIVLNGDCLKIYPQSEIGVEWIDDQALFNDHLRTALINYNSTNVKQVISNIQVQYESLVRLLRSNYKYDAIHFPKTMKHYFLYVYSFIQKLKSHSINCYNIYQIVNCTLQTFSKKLYLRSYKLQNGQLKNIKSNKGIFQNYPVVFIQNGSYLLMVFSDTSVSQIKDIFGYYDSISSLANSHYELPELETNLQQRLAINRIRSNNHQTFLRLKLVDVQSSFFDNCIVPQLYNKAKHLDFLRKAWKNA